MTISRLAGLLFMVALFSQPAISAASDDLTPPDDYLHAKLKQNDIVFLGTKHKQPEILGFIAGLIPSLKGVGVTHLGLKIPSDQQEVIDALMLESLGFLNLPKASPAGSEGIRRKRPTKVCLSLSKGALLKMCRG